MRLSGHRLRLRIAVALVAAGFALIGASLLSRPGGWKPWEWLTAAEEDGSWAAVSIDGRPVSWREYRISISEGAVTGGRDGCNDWSYTEDPPSPRGERAILSTLQACPEDDPVRRAYWALRHEPKVRLRPNGRLQVSSGGHEGLFRRCEWRTEKISTPGYHSETRACVPV